jgi:hypothetical protein
MGSIGPQFPAKARRTEPWSCRRALSTRAPVLQAGGSLENSEIVAIAPFNLRPLVLSQQSRADES